MKRIESQAMVKGEGICPLVSVILPVYNGATYLKNAIESTLQQTYENIEIIIINDGSTDDSALIIQQFQDSRIRFFDLPNQGLAATLNWAIERAKGDYIARQDQDDICLPQRFEKQVAFLNDHADCGMVGSWASIVEGDRESGRVHCHPSENAILQFDLLFDNPFVHSSMMIRRAVFETVGLYCTERSRQPPEDYELWSRIARCYPVANIPEILLIYREVPQSMSRTGENPFRSRIMKISRENIAHHLGRDPSDEIISDLVSLVHRDETAPCRFSFREYSNFVRAASERIVKVTGSDSCGLRTRTSGFLVNLRHHYFMRRYGRVLGALLRFGDRAMRRMKIS
jgi:glycosyltransferase involved in cell wall biosynthesis